LNEERGRGSHKVAAERPGHPPLHCYLIARCGNKGLELPHVFLDSGEEVLPVFSSSEAARRFLSSLALDEGWYVREFSAGELVSMLFAFCAGIKRVLVDPLPGCLSAEDALASVVGRDGFMDSLVGDQSFHPVAGARL
jgi:hypothetical protein